MQGATWLVLMVICVTILAKQGMHHPPTTSTKGLKRGVLSQASASQQTGWLCLLQHASQQRSIVSRRKVSKQVTRQGMEVDLSMITTKLEAQRSSTSKPMNYHGWLVHLAGISLGVLAYGVFMCFYAWGKPSSLEEESGLVQASMSEAGLAIHGNLVQVRPVFFSGALFKQFSWCPEADVERSLRIHDVQGRQVALAAGALIRSAESTTPEIVDDGEYDYRGELSLLVGPTVWAVLRLSEANPQASCPSFQILTAQGSLYAEVKLLSDAKCIVEGPPPLKRRLMTVVGNFCHNDFFCGDRNIHVWIAQAGTERTLVGAQCETRIENLRSSGGSRRARSYFVSTTEHADTPLVMAVMLGLQEVHTMIALNQRQRGTAGDAEDGSAGEVAKERAESGST